MEKFLKHVAETVKQEQKGDYKDVVFLTPNRRAGLFLQKELNKLHDHPIWSPRLFTIDDWVRHHSGFAEADRLSCIYHLYQIWKKEVHRQEKFENFYFWGDRLINDFDLIDKYLINEDHLFTTLLEEKEIEAQFGDWEEELKDYLHQFWSSIASSKKGKDGSDHVQIAAFLELWKKLPFLKKALENSLKESGLAYGGMMYRTLANDISQLDKWKDFDIYLIGFNRLNKCEERIINYCIDKLSASSFWNFDSDVLKNNFDYNDAGRFLKKRPARQLEKSTPMASKWKESSKAVQIYGISKQAGQAKFIGDILQRSKVPYEETMIILPDESLLLPLLGALPDDVETVNVSMGVALKETPMFTLIESYLKLHENYDTTSETYYRKDVLEFLQHPYIPASASPFESVHVAAGELQALDSPGLPYFFKTLEKENASQLFESFLNGLKELHQWHVKQNFRGGGLAEYNAEVIVFAFQRIRRLKSIYEEQEMALDFPSLTKLMRHYFKNARIPFKGEPLEGLQILGPLEARNLDFAQLIIPNMNEGVFPGSPSASMIPFHLQKAYGLPTYEEEMAEYAYYFYMSLSRSPKAHFLYNLIPDETGGKEMSRFLQNLDILELPNWDLKELQQTQEAGLKPAPDITIRKDERILKKIKAHLEAGISPSALNTYLLCPLKYYFKYIEKLREEFDAEEGYTGQNIGKVLHKTMEELYQAHEGRTVSKEDIKALKEQVGPTIEHTLASELGIDLQFQKEGEALLIKKLVEDYVNKILLYDEKRAPFIMHEHELNIKGDVFIGDGQINKIHINGHIDRLDEKDGIVSIIDYKSGNVGYRERGGQIISISSLLDQEEKQHKEALQLFLYASVLKGDERAKGKDITVGLYTLREMHDPETYDPRIFIKKGRARPLYIDMLEDEHMTEFRDGLEKLVEHMLDPEILILQTDNKDLCKFCPFIQICKRR